MKKVIVFMLIFINSTIIFSKDIAIKFYPDEIAVDFDISILIKHKVRENEKSVSSFFDKLENTQYKSLISDLEKIRLDLNLNDWLYYKFIKDFSETIAFKETNNYKALLNAFLLAKSGYDVRVCYDKQIDLYIYTNDKIYLSNKFYKSKKTYYNLSYVDNPEIGRKRELNLSKIVLNKNGVPFSFQMTQLPQFKSPEVYKKEIFFKGKIFTVNINKAIVDIFHDYPHLQMETYFNVPLSNEAYNSFISIFKKELESLDTISMVREILSFVRLQNEHVDDLVNFGKEKPMIPEEVLYYNFADCEDKSALFYYLINELLELPMIILHYPHHVNVAVKLHGDFGEPIIYKGEKYYVCEPSSLFDNTDIGFSKISEKYTPKIIDLSIH